MARVFITGSNDGLGRGAAESLLDDGHEVVVHARSTERLETARDLLDRGATGVVGELRDRDEVRSLAAAVDAMGPMDAVVHNAGVYRGRGLLPVNVVAPYLLTCLMHPAPRLVYLSSGLHLAGRGDADLGALDWRGTRLTATYADSKLYVTALMAAVARIRPGVLSNAVDPGWMPTKMGGPEATGDLRDGSQTQAWLAVSDDLDARTAGGYWHRGVRRDVHELVHDEAFQDRLLGALALETGVALA